MPPMPPLCSLPDDALLERLQRAALGYFVELMNPRNGLVPDTSRDNSPVSIAVGCRCWFDQQGQPQPLCVD